MLNPEIASLALDYATSHPFERIGDHAWISSTSTKLRQSRGHFALTGRALLILGAIWFSLGLYEMIFNRHEPVQTAQHALPRNEKTNDVDRSNNELGTSVSNNAVAPEGRPWPKKGVQLFQLLAALGLLGSWPLIKAGRRRLTIADERGAALENTLRSQLSLHRNVAQQVDSRKEFLEDNVLCESAECAIWKWDYRLNVSKVLVRDYDDPIVDRYLQAEMRAEERIRETFPDLISCSEIFRQGVSAFEFPEPEKIVTFQVPGLGGRQLEFIRRSHIERINERRSVYDAAMRCPLPGWQEALACQQEHLRREEAKEDAERDHVLHAKEEQRQARRMAVTVHLGDI
ncbi:hypothetical protein [Hyphomicrobium sp.]|uniref:hypothetical protein n=1 Tax=Hyphomicrobium sp. TaxID=82 RepID=UPI001DB31F40|nr:hypothetical protein [Hyphomicrobium sp.]MBY0559317.1 hypothetical protein [Hyphomicrobium sp.]